MKLHLLNALKNTASFYGKALLGHTIKPFKIRLAVTNRCNSRCRMCSVWKAPQTPAEELTLAEYDQIFTTNREYFSRVKHVSLTGGEPLLRHDIADMVRLVRRHFPGATLNMNTNGFRTDLLTQLASTLAAERIPVVYNVSLDGLGEVHDQMRGIPHAFEMASASIRALKELKETTRRVKVNVNFTITQQNAADCEAVCRFCRENGCEFNPIMPVFGELYKNDGLDLSLSDETRARLISDFEKMRPENPGRSLAFLVILDELRKKPRDFRCWAGHVMILIEENGDVFPNGGCPSNYVLGNLRATDYSMRKLLNSEQAREVLRNRVWRCRSCRIPCEALTTLKYPEALQAYHKMRAHQACVPVSDDTD